MTALTCPRCGTALERDRKSATLVIWDCPDPDCQPGGVAG